MFFNIDCYIIDADDKKIKVKIIDKDSLDKFIKNLNNLYKTKTKKGIPEVEKKDFDNIQDKFYLKISKKTKFNINNFNYNTLKDLIGTNVKISGESKYYSFTIENNEDEKIFKTGYSLICNKIYT